MPLQKSRRDITTALTNSLKISLLRHLRMHPWTWWRQLLSYKSRLCGMSIIGFHLTLFSILRVKLGTLYLRKLEMNLF